MASEVGRRGAGEDLEQKDISQAVMKRTAGDPEGPPLL